jgi:8-oxo-dGTP pyrophosphatase MutT (NUDIX family)
MWDHLRHTLKTRQRRALRCERHAAVLVPVIDDGQGLRVLLTRRTEALPTHKGQVAFPGGSVDPGDASVVHTALREAREEIGLAPEAVEVLGPLDDFLTVYGDMAVTPILGRLPALPPLTPEPGEVARIFDIPWEVLRDAQSWRVEEVQRLGQTWPVYFCDYDQETLWGLSAYITMHLLALTPEGAPYRLPF